MNRQISILKSNTIGWLRSEGLPANLTAMVGNFFATKKENQAKEDFKTSCPKATLNCGSFLGSFFPTLLATGDGPSSCTIET